MSQIISYYAWEFGVILGGITFMCLVRSLHRRNSKIRITNETSELGPLVVSFPETNIPEHLDEFWLAHAEEKALLLNVPAVSIWNGYFYSGSESIRDAVFESTAKDLFIIEGKVFKATNIRELGFHKFGIIDCADKNVFSKYGTISPKIRIGGSDLAKLKSHSLFFGSSLSATLPFFIASAVILI